MTDKSRNILIVDDDKSIASSLGLIITKSGYNVDIAESAERAINIVKNGKFNIALIDIILPDKDGVSLLASLKKIDPDLRGIVITGYASIETAIGALNRGASAYLTKPLHMDEVLATVNEIFEKIDLEQEKRIAEEELRKSIVRLKETLDGVMRTLEAIIEL